MAADETTHRFIVENDWVGKTEAEIQEEMRVMAERAERVRRRLMNQSFPFEAPASPRKPPKRS